MGTITKVTAGGGTHYIASTAYCYCDTASSTAAKVAKVIGDQADSANSAEFTLIKGTTVHVKFVYSNTASSPTLAVGGTTAKSIVKYGTTSVGTNAAASWNAGAVVELTYDGSRWVINNKLEIDSSLSSGSLNPVQNKQVYDALLTGNSTFKILRYKSSATSNPGTTTSGNYGDIIVQKAASTDNHGVAWLCSGKNSSNNYVWTRLCPNPDTSMSSTSTNTVQNKIIKAYVDNQIAGVSDTHRPIQLNGTEILGNNTTPLNLIPGNNVTITNDDGDVTISASGGGGGGGTSNGIYSVIGTQTSTTASWTGNIDAPELYDGMTIAYYLPRTSSSNVTLNLALNGAGGKNKVKPENIYEGYFTTNGDPNTLPGSLTIDSKYKTVSANITAGTYTFSCNLPSDNCKVLRIILPGDSIPTSISDNNNQYTFTASADGTVWICFRKGDSTDFTDDVLCQIESGSTATEYAPYVSATTGAIDVYCTGTARMGTQYSAGSTILLTYYSANSISTNGTSVTTASWRHADYSIANSDTIPAAYTTGQGAIASKTAKYTGYKLRTYNYFTWVIDTDNTAQSTLTLNVNGTGAKTIYINGSPSSSTNYTLNAGTYIVFYDGSVYRLSTNATVQMNVTYANAAGSASTATNATKVNNHTVESDVPANLGNVSTLSYTEISTWT